VFTPPTPPFAFTPTAKSGSGIGGRRPDGPRDTGEPVSQPEPERTEQAPTKDG